jgi:hypothetical protein
VSGSSIEEKEEKAEESLNEEKEKAEEDLKEILETIENDDVEEIKKLTNGKLEDTLNVILRYEVKQNHLKVLKNVLDSFWYSPASSMDFDENKEELAKWFDYQIEDERKKITEEDVDLPAGSYLFGTVENFVNKFIKGGLVDDKSQAFDVLDKITDVAGNKLNNIEKRAITVIVTYLRAKKMSK